MVHPSFKKKKKKDAGAEVEDRSTKHNFLVAIQKITLMMRTPSILGGERTIVLIVIGYQNSSRFQLLLP